MEALVGEIRIFGFDYVPEGWFPCNGMLVPLRNFTALFSILGNYYGGNGTTNFAVPNLQGTVPLGAGQGPGLTPRVVGESIGSSNVTLTTAEVPMHSHSFTASAPVGTIADSINPAGNYYAAGNESLYSTQTTEEPVANANAVPVVAVGGNVAHNNMQPYLALNFCLCYNGEFPVREDSGISGQEQYVGEIRMFAGNYAPGGWSFCDGKTLPISGNEVLFVLIGTTYGGDGQTTFALPDMRGRVPLGPSQGTGFTNRSVGQSGGSEMVTLLVTQIPAHTHGIDVSNLRPLAKDYSNASSSGTSDSSLGKYSALVPGLKQYGKTKGTGKTSPIFSATLPPYGQNHAHENMQPSLGVNFIISLYGIFPSRS